MSDSYDMSIYKFSGAGNDFVVLDGRGADVSAFRQAGRITELCREYRTDGLMILDKADGYDFAMEFYNPDGSGGMMCGNGGRCIVAFADYLGLKPASLDGIWHFLAPDGPHEAAILEFPEGTASQGLVHPRTSVGGGARWMSVRAADETDNGRGRSERSERSSLGGSSLRKWTVRLKMIDVEEVKPMMGGYFLNTGTRHFVKFVPSVEGIDMEKDGPEIRWDEAFQPEGTNANFVQVAPDALHVRTFEKGVEAETLACGTGLTASAIVACYSGVPGAEKGSRLQCRRGDWLQVDFQRDGTRYTDVYLTGPAELVKVAQVIDNQ
jgi:diaminopimelate epimerase